MKENIEYFEESTDKKIDFFEKKFGEDILKFLEASGFEISSVKAGDIFEKGSSKTSINMGVNEFVGSNGIVAINENLNRIIFFKWLENDYYDKHIEIAFAFFDKYKEFLYEDINWIDLFNDNRVDEKAFIFSDILMEIIEKIASKNITVHISTFDDKKKEKYIKIFKKKNISNIRFS